ncbi:hypothetical protein [Mycoplasmopsis bovis]|nr:hypothetical protein [Mycoplasmopsis bovis]
MNVNNAPLIAYPIAPPESNINAGIFVWTADITDHKPGIEAMPHLKL